METSTRPSASEPPSARQPDIQVQLARYERLIEISQQLSSTLDVNNLLRHIVSAASELTDSEGASILLTDEASGELRFEMASNLTSAQYGDIIVPLEGSIAGWVVTHGEARVIQDVSREPSFFKPADDMLQFRTRNVLAVPMKARNRVIGALESVNKKDQARYNSEDIKTLTILAGQAAIAIENAKLFQQSDFMSEMVHELRTPLLALKTSTALLVRPELPDEKRRDLVQTMSDETDRLIRLTNDFLDLARLESGRVQLDIAPFDLDRLVRECEQIVQAQAQERGITVIIAPSGFQLLADRGKIKQVLLNLLANAIKYNRDGGSVTVRARDARNPDIEMVQIAVEDTGYGISKENQRSMFQKFFRGSDTAGFTQGTGLGLAIARHIVEAHGGSIWLTSEPGVGSVFYLTLPRAS